MNNVMIDLETLATVPGTKILSIGAVRFNPITGYLGEEFYAKLNSELQANRVASQSTMDWWNRQDPLTRLEAFSGTRKLSEVLSEFRNWLGSNPIVWGNGSTFDISILEHAYGYSTPWKFWNVRDVRTVVDLAEGVIDKSDFPFEGNTHNALDDAKHQARYISGMYSEIKSILSGSKFGQR